MSLWTVTPSSTYLAQIRDEIEGDLGTSVQWDGTVDGAWSNAAAELAYRNDQGMALAIANQLVATAPLESLVAQGAELGLTPNAATQSRYSVTAAGTGTIPAGTQVQGGGTDGRALWTVLAETAVTPGTLVIIEAVTAGPVSLPSTATLTLVQPVTGVTSLTWDVGDGDPYQVGRAAESTARFRVRVSQGRKARNASPEGIKTRLLQIDWVLAVDVASSAGAIAITISPAPVGADQEAELGAAIYAAVGVGPTLTGSSSVTTTDVNGDTATIYYTAGGTQSVATVVTLTTDATISDDDAIEAVEAAVEAVYAALSQGEAVLRLRLNAAISIPGVTAATLSLDGSTTVASVTPTLATDVLVPSPLTVTVS